MIDRLRGKRVIASVSGGKDSAAMCLWLQEQGIEHDRVFMDTGWEHDATYEYLRGPLTEKLGPIVEIRAAIPTPTVRVQDLITADALRPRVRAAIEAGSSMVTRAIHKGLLPARRPRWCTEELKMQPFRRYLEGIDDEIISAVGIRWDESAARAEMTEWEWSDGLDCEVWRPILSWTEQDVIDIHARHGLRPNPLYLLGARRVGCWPCVNASKAELRLIADTDPGRIDLVRELEQDVAAIQRKKIEARGETQDTPPGWFKPSGGGRWQIDEAVAWSRTAHGGKQYELFAPDGDAGCMRWGLCDTGTK